MYRVKERFVVMQTLLYVTVGGAPRTITQGSWVPEGAEIAELTSDELAVYGEYVSGDGIVEQTEESNGSTDD
jgi:hypothetical protein